MKKLCVLLLLLSLLLGCVGCGADHGEGNTTPIATDPPAETTPTVTEPPLDTTPAGSEPPADTTPVESTPSVGPFAPVPPYRWWFDSYEELRELKEMTKEDNDAILAYMDSKGNDLIYYFWGPHVTRIKEGLIELFDTIGNWYLPYVDPVTGYSYLRITYYPREDNPLGKHFIITYYNEERMKVIDFVCTVKEDGGDEAENEAPIAFTMSVEGQTVPVRQSSGNPNWYCCTVYSTNMRVLFTFWNSDPATIKNTYDGKIEFLTLNELMGD